MELFRNLSLSAKIISLPLMVTLFLLVLGLTSYFRLEQIGGNVGHIADVLAKETNEATHLMKNVLQKDRLVQTYLKTGDEALVAQFQELEGENQATIARTKDLIRDSDRTRLLEEIVQQNAEYSSAFVSKVASNTRTQIEVSEDLLNNKGPLIEQTLTDIVETAFASQATEVANSAGTTLKEFLLARLYLFKYLAGNSTTDLERVRLQLLATENGFLDMEAVLTSQRHQRWAQVVRTTMQEYSRGVETVASAVQARDQALVEVIDVNGSRIVENTNRLEEAVWADLYKNTDEVKGIVSTTSKTTIGLTLAAALLGMVLALLVGRAITRPLVKMTAVAKRIALGDIDQKIEHRSGDEVGALADSYRDLIGYK